MFSLMIRLLPVLVLALAAGSATAGSVNWVYFTDKGVSPLEPRLAALEETYDARAIERRRARRTAPGLFDARDLSVAPGYVGAVERAGARVRVRSRWLNAVSVLADEPTVAAIRSLPFVSRVEPVRSIATPRTGTSAVALPAGPGDFYGAGYDQVDQLSLVGLHELGYTGGGVRIGVLDTGFALSHDAFNDPDHPLQVIAAHDFVNKDDEVGPEAGDLPNQHHHGTYILGTMAAHQPGTLVGGAFDAAFILAKVEDLSAEYAAEEDLFVAGLEFIEANGGDVATSSVVIFDHYDQDELDGLTSVMSIGYHVATINGIHCFQGAGNEGHDADPATARLVPPADAFDVVTVGAVDVTDDIAWFSSDGPSADGRVKPEVLARGLDTVTVHPNLDDALIAVSGTSLSTPLAAAVCACLVEAHPTWTPRQMRAALFQVAQGYVENGTFDPTFVRGYGIVDALAAVTTDPPLADLDDDFKVGGADLGLLLGAWGPCETINCPADLNHDGTVDGADLGILLADWR